GDGVRRGRLRGRGRSRLRSRRLGRGLHLDRSRGRGRDCRLVDGLDLGRRRGGLLLRARAGHQRVADRHGRAADDDRREDLAGDSTALLVVRGRTELVNEFAERGLRGGTVRLVMLVHVSLSMSGANPVHRRGMRWSPAETSVTGSLWTGLNVTKGHRWFNELPDRG